jgi:hypothetical protein
MDGGIIVATKKVRRRWFSLAILCTVGLTCLVGCGVKRVPVSGTVTLDGQPLNTGTLTFSPDSAKGNTAQIAGNSPVRDGHYELQTLGVTKADSGPGLPLGWYKVTWNPPTVGSKKHPLTEVEVNDIYKSVEKTPLSVEVKDNPDPDAYNFKLTK